MNTYSDGIKVLRTIGKLFRNYKPFVFFGVISSVLLILAVMFFIPIVVKYIQTGLVPNFPTLIVCGFVTIVAIQSFFSGLILETIRQKNQQDFEMELIRIQEQFEVQLGEHK